MIERTESESLTHCRRRNLLPYGWRWWDRTLFVALTLGLFGALEAFFSEHLSLRAIPTRAAFLGGAGGLVAVLYKITLRRVWAEMFPGAYEWRCKKCRTFVGLERAHCPNCKASLREGVTSEASAFEPLVKCPDQASGELELTQEQRRFLESLKERFPELAAETRLEEAPSSGVVKLRVRPTALRPESPFFLEVWMDSDDAPSISFGTWHTHGDVYSWGSTDLDVQSDVILDALEDILNDRIVLVCARTTEGKLIQWDRLEDIANLEKVEELLTDPDAPQELQVRSWSGKREGPLAALLDQR